VEERLAATGLTESLLLAVDILDAMTGHGRKTVAATYGELPPGALLRELSKIPDLKL
jgi:hypothetical protein